MTEQSYVFDLTLVETFWDNWNKSGWYGADTMIADTSNYEIVLADTSSTNPLNNISDALENGALKTTVNVHKNITGEAFLVYGGEVGSWERTISMQDDCVVNIGDSNIYMKALFIRNSVTNKVIAYCILSDRFPVTNKIIVPKDSVVWRIRENVVE
jgi:hypothetical protein